MRRLVVVPTQHGESIVSVERALSNSCAQRHMNDNDCQQYMPDSLALKLHDPHSPLSSNSSLVESIKSSRFELPL
jgi:hypothetical protein